MSHRCRRSPKSVLHAGALVLLSAGGCDNAPYLAAPLGDPSSVASAPAVTSSETNQILAAEHLLVLCHRASVDRGFIRITVAVAAEAAHRRHGDAAPGEAAPHDLSLVFDNECVLRAPQSLLYVTNTAAGTLSVLDRTTLGAIASVVVGSFAEGLAITPGGMEVYVVAAGPDRVTVIETATNTPVATIGVGSDPIAVAITPDGTRAYVLNRTGSSVSVISTATHGVIATISVAAQPTGIAITPDGTAAYIAHNISPSQVSKIDLGSNTVSAAIPLASNARGIAITPDGTTALVSNGLVGSVSVINTSTDVVITTINGVGPIPEGIAIARNGQRAYVASFTGQSVFTVDLSTYSVSGQLNLGLSSRPFRLALADNDGTLYVTNHQSNTVSVVDVVSGVVVDVITGFNTAWGVQILDR
jgi:YVTN family beta-propeller protein